MLAYIRTFRSFFWKKKGNNWVAGKVTSQNKGSICRKKIQWAMCVFRMACAPLAHRRRVSPVVIKRPAREAHITGSPRLLVYTDTRLHRGSSAQAGFSVVYWVDATRRRRRRPWRRRWRARVRAAQPQVVQIGHKQPRPPGYRRGDCTHLMSRRRRR